MFQDTIETTLRSLWFVAAALILWSGVMWFADHAATQIRHEDDVTWKDTLIIGVVQCLALIPGVSRSGATMSAGLLRDLDRVTVTKLSFFLSIPALLGATVLQSVTEYDNISGGVGWFNTIVATVVSFVVGYLAVAWLLKFIAKNTYSLFIGVPAGARVAADGAAGHQCARAAVSSAAALRTSARWAWRATVPPGVSITVSFHPDRLLADGRTVAESLVADGRYRSQFETGISNGGLTAFPGGDRDVWEQRMFAGAYPSRWRWTARSTAA